MSKSKINCFNYVVTVTNDKKDKFYSFPSRIREHENLLEVITIPEGSSFYAIVPIETATEAHGLAENKNRNAKALGCALYT